ncbi:MAG: transposase [Saprospiraceae bacterium]|nr:transposase [Candidatus Parvibacillus calidus]
MLADQYVWFCEVFIHFEGNMADCKTLEHVIDELRVSTSGQASGSTVVLDAGIATEENLRLLEQKGYKYVCVSRRSGRLKQGKTRCHRVGNEEQTENYHRKSRFTKHTDYILKVPARLKSSRNNL